MARIGTSERPGPDRGRPDRGGPTRSERRRHERFPVRTPSSCAAISPWSTVALADLSTSGARLLSRMRPPVGTGMLVSVAPDMMATGRVARHTPDGFVVAFGPLPSAPAAAPAAVPDADAGEDQSDQD